jgi:hypothetical protein
VSTTGRVHVRWCVNRTAKARIFATSTAEQFLEIGASASNFEVERAT